MSGPAASSVSPLLSDAVSWISGQGPVACADRALLLADDLGIDSVALAELIEVISTRAAIVIPDEATGRVRTVEHLQDILDARRRALAPRPRRRT